MFCQGTSDLSLMRSWMRRGQLVSARIARPPVRRGVGPSESAWVHDAATHGYSAVDTPTVPRPTTQTDSNPPCRAGSSCSKGLPFRGRPVVHRTVRRVANSVPAARY
jgi:hypothetical protein